MSRTESLVLTLRKNLSKQLQKRKRERVEQTERDGQVRDLGDTTDGKGWVIQQMEIDGRYSRRRDMYKRGTSFRSQ